MDKYLRNVLKVTTTLLLFIMIFFILIAAKNFLYPIALALLLSYLLFPLVSFFERRLRFPRILAVLVAIFMGLGIIFGIGEIVMLQVKVFIKDFPIIRQQAIDNINSFHETIAHTFNLSVEQQQDWLRIQLTNFLDRSNTFFTNVFKTMTGTVTRLIFIIIFTIFMLLYRDRGKNFILKVTKNDPRFTEKLLEQISKVTMRYMIGVLTVVSILAISHSVVLSIIGVRYAIFLGILAASISIIPYFGTLASTLIPLTFSLILTQNPYEPVWIIIYFLIINFVENNILTPSITGGNVNLNPFITILGLIVGAMVWGIPGMIIIIPTLGVIKIICDNIEGLGPYGYILGVDRKVKKILIPKNLKRAKKDYSDEEKKSENNSKD